MTRFFTILLVVALSAFRAFGGIAPNDAFNDGIDRTDPNFVKASLLIMSPGDELYSCAGHSCIRLECPTFNLDYCFSYESESVKDKIFTFFMGKLKMGMFAIPTADYLKLGRESGRGVMQYTLNLPPDAKQRLWKILDERVAQGAYLPYDYIARGCAHSALDVLMEALRPYRLVVDQWPEKYLKWTRREFVREATEGYLWQQMPLCAICGTEADKATSRFENVVVPLGLLEILRIAKVNGTQVIDGEGVELVAIGGGRGATALPAGETAPAAQGNGHMGRVTIPFFTPMTVSGFVVALAVVNWFVKANWLDWIFLAFQSLAGAFFTFLVIFSDLPSTGWNWLIVPFNLLPLAFWKWRQKWALWFAGVLVLWEFGMIAWPHMLTLPAYLVLVGAYVLMYARIGWKWSHAAEPAAGGPRSAPCGPSGSLRSGNPTPTARANPVAATMGRPHSA